MEADCGQQSVCDPRDRRGGRRGRHAAEAPQRVLVVSSHVEPHAATPLPQPLCAGRPDEAQQTVCFGETLESLSHTFSQR